MTDLDALRLERDRALRAGEFELAEQLGAQLRIAEQQLLEPELSHGCSCFTEGSRSGDR